jgi:hypothetical protein
MKIKTHNFFNIGVLTLFGTFFTIPLYSFISAIIITSPANRIIDTYGHEKNGLGMPVRTYRTHSPLRALFWGFVPALLLFAAVYYIKKGYEPFFPTPYFILLQGLLSGELHLLLDLPTEGGIFINKKRFALGHFAYNNPLINFAGILVGLFLIYITFRGGSYAKDYHTIKYLFFGFRRFI